MFLYAVVIRGGLVELLAITQKCGGLLHGRNISVREGVRCVDDAASASLVGFAMG